MELQSKDIIAFYPRSHVFRVFYDEHEASRFYGCSPKKIKKCIDAGTEVKGAILEYIDSDKVDFLFEISIKYGWYDDDDDY